MLAGTCHYSLYFKFSEAGERFFISKGTENWCSWDAIKNGESWDFVPTGGWGYGIPSLITINQNGGKLVTDKNY